MYWEMATCDHFDRQKEFLYYLLQQLHILRFGEKNYFQETGYKGVKAK